MKRSIAISLCVVLLAGCGSGGSRVDELQKSNEDLARRVKVLEDQSLQTDKKIIQQEQVIKQMYERVRDMENAVNKIEMGPTPAR
jgi:outer membrane murein-binding lipoprotein Lpp